MLDIEELLKFCYTKVKFKDFCSTARKWTVLAMMGCGTLF
ncbi:MAG: hypothetical protein P857_1093 [Candidatus Xenolissoclinum pacificiensis L6]|uniref:Uncharacterized protein n=1 Tax=Candidatus Xenolissoclinum pacificiensis L6 TaxID=1401685 RepID=W2V372_9RICK|nr:MAG: hypothetical protein P857_1093 [Candidatus Xenolissoclinum pacificiensis L6]